MTKSWKLFPSECFLQISKKCWPKWQICKNFFLFKVFAVVSVVTKASFQPEYLHMWDGVLIYWKCERFDGTRVAGIQVNGVHVQVASIQINGMPEKRNQVFIDVQAAMGELFIGNIWILVPRIAKKMPYNVSQRETIAKLIVFPLQYSQLSDGGSFRAKTGEFIILGYFEQGPNFNFSFSFSENSWISLHEHVSTKLKR